MALTKEHCKDICCVGEGHLQCKYIDMAANKNGDLVHICKKKSPERKIIDEEVKNYITKCRKKGVNPEDSGYPLADNCQGYIALLEKKQGYNISN